MFCGLDERDVEIEGGKLGGVLTAFWEAIDGGEGKLYDVYVRVVGCVFEN